MSEISVQFKTQRFNGYNKDEVNRFMQKIEDELQQRATTINALQQQITGLEEKLAQATTPDALEAAEKIELYDQLMKKMDGEFKNILAPALAKAKAIEEKAERDYEIRMDQARATADGIYELAADRIAAVVDQNMDRLYELLDNFLYSKTLPGRFKAFVKGCKIFSQKVVAGAIAVAQMPKKAYAAVSEKVQVKVAQVKSAVDTYKKKKAAQTEDAVVVEVEPEIIAEEVAEAVAE